MTRYEMLKAQGLCPKCCTPLPTDETHVLCAACRRKNLDATKRSQGGEVGKTYRRVYLKDRYERLKSESRCVECTRPLPPGTPYASCAVCRRKQAARSRKSYAKKTLAMICQMICQMRRDT